MKQKFLYVLAVSIFLLSFNTINSTYQTECTRIETDGSITLKIWDTKKGAKYKPEQARKDAIHLLLFSGITGSQSCASQPALLRNLDEQEKFQNNSKDFFDKNGQWPVYARSSSTETTLPSSIGNKKWKVYEVTVSKNELRKYLEEKQIIKSLNAGF